MSSFPLNGEASWGRVICNTCWTSATGPSRSHALAITSTKCVRIVSNLAPWSNGEITGHAPSTSGRATTSPTPDSSHRSADCTMFITSGATSRTRNARRLAKIIGVSPDGMSASPTLSRWLMRCTAESWCPLSSLPLSERSRRRRAGACWNLFIFF